MDNVPVHFTITLPDGDTYLIDGSFSGTNNADGSDFTVSHLERLPACDIEAGDELLDHPQRAERRRRAWSS
jgi:hypothetical protein